MKQIDPRATVISLFIVVFIAGYWYAILPKVKTLGKLINESETTSAALVKTPASSDGSTKNSSSDTVLLANKLLPTLDNQYDLTIQVEALAKNTGVVLTAYTMVSVSPNLGPKTTATGNEDDTKKTTATATPAVAATPQVASVANKVTVNIGIGGTYANVQQFILGLHQLERMVQIDQLTVTGGSGTTTASASSSPAPTTTPSTNQVTAQIVAFAYFLP